MRDQANRALADAPDSVGTSLRSDMLRWLQLDDTVTNSATVLLQSVKKGAEGVSISAAFNNVANNLIATCLIDCSLDALDLLCAHNLGNAGTPATDVDVIEAIADTVFSTIEVRMLELEKAKRYASALMSMSVGSVFAIKAGGDLVLGLMKDVVEMYVVKRKPFIRHKLKRLLRSKLHGIVLGDGKPFIFNSKACVHPALLEALHGYIAIGNAFLKHPLPEKVALTFEEVGKEEYIVTRSDGKARSRVRKVTTINFDILHNSPLQWKPIRGRVRQRTYVLGPNNHEEDDLYESMVLKYVDESGQSFCFKNEVLPEPQADRP